MTRDFVTFRLIPTALLAALFVLVQLVIAEEFARAEVGDVNGGGSVDISDVIHGLKIFDNLGSFSPVYPGAEIDGDGQLGLAEVIYALQTISGLKTQPSVLAPLNQFNIGRYVRVRPQTALSAPPIMR